MILDTGSSETSNDCSNIASTFPQHPLDGQQSSCVSPAADCTLNNVTRSSTRIRTSCSSTPLTLVDILSFKNSKDQQHSAISAASSLLFGLPSERGTADVNQEIQQAHWDSHVVYNNRSINRGFSPLSPEPAPVRKPPLQSSSPSSQHVTFCDNSAPAPSFSPPPGLPQRVARAVHATLQQNAAIWNAKSPRNIGTSPRPTMENSSVAAGEDGQPTTVEASEQLWSHKPYTEASSAVSRFMSQATDVPSTQSSVDTRNETVPALMESSQESTSTVPRTAGTTKNRRSSSMAVFQKTSPLPTKTLHGQLSEDDFPPLPSFDTEQPRSARHVASAETVAAHQDPQLLLTAFRDEDSIRDKDTASASQLASLVSQRSQTRRFSDHPCFFLADATTDEVFRPRPSMLESPKMKKKNSFTLPSGVQCKELPTNLSSPQSSSQNATGTNKRRNSAHPCSVPLPFADLSHENCALVGQYNNNNNNNNNNNTTDQQECLRATPHPRSSSVNISPSPFSTAEHVGAEMLTTELSRNSKPQTPHASKIQPVPFPTSSFAKSGYKSRRASLDNEKLDNGSYYDVPGQAPLSIFLGNIPNVVTPEMLYKQMQLKGKVVEVLCDFRPHCWLTAFVTFSKPAEAAKAIDTLNNRRVFKNAPPHRLVACYAPYPPTSLRCNLPPKRLGSGENGTKETLDPTNKGLAKPSTPFPLFFPKFSLEPDIPRKTPPLRRFSLLRDGPPGANLFIYGIPSDWTEVTLMQLCQEFGHIVGIRIPSMLTASGQRLNKGFGFVSYDSTESSARAFKHLMGREFLGKSLAVQLKSGEELPLSPHQRPSLLLPLSSEFTANTFTDPSASLEWLPRYRGYGSQTSPADINNERRDAKNVWSYSPYLLNQNDEGRGSPGHHGREENDRNHSSPHSDMASGLPRTVDPETYLAALKKLATIDSKFARGYNEKRSSCCDTVEDRFSTTEALECPLTSFPRAMSQLGPGVPSSVKARRPSSQNDFASLCPTWSFGSPTNTPSESDKWASSDMRTAMTCEALFPHHDAAPPSSVMPSVLPSWSSQPLLLPENKPLHHHHHRAMTTRDGSAILASTHCHETDYLLGIRGTRRFSEMFNLISPDPTGAYSAAQGEAYTPTLPKSSTEKLFSTSNEFKALTTNPLPAVYATPGSMLNAWSSPLVTPNAVAFDGLPQTPRLRETAAGEQRGDSPRAPDFFHFCPATPTSMTELRKQPDFLSVPSPQLTPPKTDTSSISNAFYAQHRLLGNHEIRRPSLSLAGAEAGIFSENNSGYDVSTDTADRFEPVPYMSQKGNVPSFPSSACSPTLLENRRQPNDAVKKKGPTRLLDLLQAPSAVQNTALNDKHELQQRSSESYLRSSELLDFINCRRAGRSSSPLARLRRTQELPTICKSTQETLPYIRGRNSRCGGSSLQAHSTPGNLSVNAWNSKAAVDALPRELPSPTLLLAASQPDEGSLFSNSVEQHLCLVLPENA